MFFSVSHHLLSTTTNSFSFRPSKPRVRFDGRLHAAAARDKKTVTPLRYGFPGENHHQQRRKERTTARAAGGGSAQTRKEKKDPARTLRTLLNGPAIVQAPCAHDAVRTAVCLLLLLPRAGCDSARSLSSVVTHLASCSCVAALDSECRVSHCMPRGMMRRHGALYLSA